MACYNNPYIPINFGVHVDKIQVESMFTVRPALLKMVMWLPQVGSLQYTVVPGL